MRACKIAQQVKTLAVEPGDLSWLLSLEPTRWKEAADSYKLTSGLHTCAVEHMLPSQTQRKKHSNLSVSFIFMCMDVLPECLYVNHMCA